MQKQNNQWFFGNGLHLDFNTNPPTSSSDKNLYTLEGSSSICDRNTGELILYTDGHNLWQADGTLVTDQMKGHASSTTSAIVVPKPGSNSHFYVFNAGETSGVDGIYLPDGRIDVTADLNTTTMKYHPRTHPGAHFSEFAWDQATGTVAVVSLNTPLPQFPEDETTEKMAVIAKPDCTGYWLVLAMDNHTDLTSDAKFYVYSINDNGVDWHKTIPVEIEFSPVGLLKFSPDGRFLAAANIPMPYTGWMVETKDVAVFDFDLASGDIPGLRGLVPLGYQVGSPYGLEFSESSRFLYCSLFAKPDPNTMCKVVQVDLTQAHMPQLTVAMLPHSTSIPSRTGLPHVQVGVGGMMRSPLPGGPIYVTRPGTNWLAAIMEPENEGAQCGFELEHIQFDEMVFEGLSAFVEYRDCMGESPCKTVDLPDILPTISLNWGHICKCETGGSLQTVTLTICNYNANVSLSGLTVDDLEVVNADGSAIGLDADGKATVSLIPAGPHCFGDIPPCTCISREFVIRSHGATPGRYKINVNGVKYGVVPHYDSSVSFEFDLG